MFEVEIVRYSFPVTAILKQQNYIFLLQIRRVLTSINESKIFFNILRPIILFNYLYIDDSTPPQTFKIYHKKSNLS